MKMVKLITVFQFHFIGKIWIIGGRIYDDDVQGYRITQKSQILSGTSEMEWKSGSDLVQPRHSEVFLTYFNSN